MESFLKKAKTVKLLFYNIYRNNLDINLKKEIDLLAEEVSELFKEFKKELRFLENIDDSKTIRNLSFKVKKNAWCSMCSQSGEALQDFCVEVSCEKNSNIICICPSCIKKMYKKIKENS